MSTSLAVRHRPRTFADVTGQQHLVAVLSAAARRTPVPQQILLAGPSGVGKTTLARVFAAALFCPNVDNGQPCGQCDTCQQVTGPGGRHPDVIELDAASHGGIDQIRALADEAHLAPLLAPWRVYIIDEAHGLTKDGGQAFLRLLEEPPAHTIFVLATTDPQKLPDALRGRCLLCYATPPTRDELIANLARVVAAERWQLARDVLELVVDNTDPALGVRGTVTNLDKVAGGSTGPVDPAQAASLLGAANPAHLAALTAAVVSGQRAEALAALGQLTSTVSRDRVHSQLQGWAHTRLRERVADGSGVDEPLWWLTVLADTPARHLEVAVAKMADPHLGGPAGLAALCERAETAAARLAGLAAGRALAPASLPHETTPGDTSAGSTRPAQPARATRKRAAAHAAHAGPPAAQPPGHSLAASGPTPPASAASAASGTFAAVQVDDPDLLALINSVGRLDGRAGLALRRARVLRAGSRWQVTASGVADTDRFAQVLTDAAAGHGWTVTCV